MTISFSPKNNGQELQPPTPVRTGERPVDWHARIALVLAVCVLAVEVALMGLLARIATYLGWPFPLADLLILSVVVAIAVGGLYGFRWTRRYVLRIWDHEDEDRALARPVREIEFVETVIPFPTGEAIRALAARLLTLHHTAQNDDERKATRPWCVARQICTDDEWEYANKVLQALCAKKERGWVRPQDAPTFEQAMHLLYRGGFDPDGFDATINGQYISFRPRPLTTGAKRA